MGTSLLQRDHQGILVNGQPQQMKNITGAYRSIGAGHWPEKLVAQLNIRLASMFDTGGH
jgi:hypothetical protein